jgi:hypothetical protein
MEHFTTMEMIKQLLWGDNHDFLLKVVLFGPMKTGKTKFVEVLLNRKSKNDYEPTLCMAVYSKIIPISIDDRKRVVKLRLVDTSGDVRCHSLIKGECRSHGLNFLFYSDNALDEAIEMYEDFSTWTCPGMQIIVLVSDKPNSGLQKLPVHDKFVKFPNVKHHFHLDFSQKEQINAMLRLLIPECGGFDIKGRDGRVWH